MKATPEQKQAALNLAYTGLYYCAEISRATGVRHKTVQELCDRHGVKLPLGFKVWLKAKQIKQL